MIKIIMTTKYKHSSRVIYLNNVDAYMDSEKIQVGICYQIRILFT